MALGDSISIDDYAGGPGRGGASLLVANRDDDFPEWRGRDLRTALTDVTFSLLATDGATTRTLVDGQLPRLAALRVRPTLVTVTIGGNDLLGAYGDTAAARTVIDRVAAGLARALTEIAGHLAPFGRVVVGTVYDPSDGTGDAVRLGLPAWPDAVAVLGELNDRLREVALGHGAGVAEIARHFHGHGLLAGDPGRREARPAERDLWFCNLIEPNAWGAGGVREAFWAAVRPVDPAVSPAAGPAPPPPSTTAVHSPAAPR
ncbi:SGNH/GDSL hydrolase family protein [Modestobacter marinus]|uniref:SGNH/GDSL hydrolase family protein n=1 Tax=Modestobacter marinus TaxID=477641 RepID=UPI001C968A98|nr:SGNH/GDSL hydrolase family protein [Modestobacter marinus]